MDCSKMQSAARKVKKKQMKDELDRIKHAERKKRRLEKALATSAAIRSELEKKKQKKKEEQQRLEEEGALIAEAVALHVLLDDGLDDSCDGLQTKGEEINQWEYNNRFGLLMNETTEMVPQQNISKHSIGGIRLVSDSYTWNAQGNCDFMVSSEPLGGNFSWPYIGWGGLDSTPFSAGLAAAQAFSSLKIGDETPLDSYFLNHTLRLEGLK